MRGNLELLALTWMPLDTHHPPKHCCRTIPSIHGNGSPRWQWSPSQDNASGLQIFQVSMCSGVCPGTSWIYGGSTSQPTGVLSPCLDRSEPSPVHLWASMLDHIGMWGIWRSVRHIQLFRKILDPVHRHSLCAPPHIQGYSF